MYVSLTRRKQWKQIRNKETTYHWLIKSSEYVWPEGIPLDFIHHLFVKFLLTENFATWITPAHDNVIFMENCSQLSSVHLNKQLNNKL
jgi:hypothetical protein